MDYSRVGDILKRQRDFVIRKVAELCLNQRVYKGEQVETLAGEPGEDGLRIRPQLVPGVVQGGWKGSDLQSLRRSQQRSLQGECRNIYQSMMKHKSVWPFKQAVVDVPDYYQVITQPMNMRILEERIQANHYKERAQFIKDVQLIFSNCKLYNQPDTPYYMCALDLEEFVKPLLEALGK